MFYNCFYTSFQADVISGKVEIGGKGRIMFPCICSAVLNVLPCGENMGIKGELTGQQVGLRGIGLRGIPESSRLCTLLTVLTVRRGILFSFLNFALLFLNQIYKKTMEKNNMKLTILQL